MNKKTQVVWLYGLSGAGKTTIANALSEKLIRDGINVRKLDGDELRKGLNKNLGFSDADRVENIRRSAEVANLFAESSLCCVCSFITPTESIRNMVRGVLSQHQLIDIHVKASIEVCQQRDPKGFYKRVENGEIKNFTGVDSVFEFPLNPKWEIDTEKMSIDQAVNYITTILNS